MAFGTGYGLMVYETTLGGSLVHQKDLSGTSHKYFQVLMIMNLYLDIDGVLVDYATDAPTENATIFIDYTTSEFDCYWLMTHCQGDSARAVEYLAEYFPPKVIAKLQVVKPTIWRTLKTEGIDFSKPFIWLDDCPFQSEIETLDSKGASDSLFKVNLGNRDELLGVIEFLKRVKAYHFTCTTSLTNC